MHRIDTSTAQKDKFGPGKNGFTEGSPQTGVPPTALNAAFFDSVQEELAAVIEGAGLVLDPDQNNQLVEAISKMITTSVPEAPVTSVNAKTGAVVLTAADVGALPDSYTPPAAPVTSVNTKTGAVVLSAADVGALPDTTVIPPVPDLSPYETKADANARFVQGVQLGAELSVPNDASVIHAGIGSFWSSVNRDHSGADDLNWYSKPIQININGVWTVIQG
ncbi:hypothetical protein [Dryocola sp. LX212]